MKITMIPDLSELDVLFIGGTPSLNLGVYALTIFDLSEVETTSLLNKMTKHFHLSPKQQEPLALAA